MSSLFLAVLLAKPALAAEDWKPTGADNDCVFYRAASEGSLQPMRAVCDWPLPAESVHQRLAEAGELEEVFSTVRESEILEVRSDGSRLTYQWYQALRFFNREVVLVVHEEDIPDGWRHTWVRAVDQSGLRGKGGPVVAMDNTWEITATPTGCRLVFELRYDIGGNVPETLVSWFQGAGIQLQLSELRASIDEG